VVADAQTLDWHIASIRRDACARDEASEKDIGAGAGIRRSPERCLREGAGQLQRNCLITDQRQCAGSIILHSFAEPGEIDRVGLRESRDHPAQSRRVASDGPFRHRCRM
jgi:hypothetical protein